MGQVPAEDCGGASLACGGCVVVSGVPGHLALHALHPRSPHAPRRHDEPPQSYVYGPMCICLPGLGNDGGRVPGYNLGLEQSRVVWQSSYGPVTTNELIHVIQMERVTYMKASKIIA